jgi:hypothetical protein
MRSARKEITGPNVLEAQVSTEKKEKRNHLLLGLIKGSTSFLRRIGGGGRTPLARFCLAEGGGGRWGNWVKSSVILYIVGLKRINELLGRLDPARSWLKDFVQWVGTQARLAMVLQDPAAQVSRKRPTAGEWRVRTCLL